MQAVFIKRALTSLLENALKHRRCIFITGPLGAGKTSLLKTLYPKESFVNLDCCFVRLDAFDSATDLLNKYQGSFVIDEIQKSKPVLNKLKDKFLFLQALILVSLKIVKRRTYCQSTYI